VNPYDDLDDAIYETFVGPCNCEHEENDHSNSGCLMMRDEDWISERPCPCEAYWGAEE